MQIYTQVLGKSFKYGSTAFENCLGHKDEHMVG